MSRQRSCAVTSSSAIKILFLLDMIHYFFLEKTARKRAVVPVIRLVSPHKDISGLSNGIIDSNLQRPDIIKKCRQQKNNIDRGTKRSSTQNRSPMQDSRQSFFLHAPKQKELPLR